MNRNYRVFPSASLVKAQWAMQKIKFFSTECNLFVYYINQTLHYRDCKEAWCSVVCFISVTAILGHATPSPLTSDSSRFHVDQSKACTLTLFQEIIVPFTKCIVNHNARGVNNIMHSVCVSQFVIFVLVNETKITTFGWGGFAENGRIVSLGKGVFYQAKLMSQAHLIFWKFCIYLGSWRSTLQGNILHATRFGDISSPIHNSFPSISTVMLLQSLFSVVAII